MHCCKIIQLIPNQNCTKLLQNVTFSIDMARVLNDTLHDRVNISKMKQRHNYQMYFQNDNMCRTLAPAQNNSKSKHLNNRFKLGQNWKTK